MEEKELIDEYRNYTQAKMRECIRDACSVYKGELRDISSAHDFIGICMLATALFRARVSPYHYWRQKKLREKMEEENNE